MSVYACVCGILYVYDCIQSCTCVYACDCVHTSPDAPSTWFTQRSNITGLAMYRTYYACDFMIALNHLFVVTVWCYGESVHRVAGEKLCTCRLMQLCGLMQPVLWPMATRHDNFDELAVYSATFGISVEEAFSCLLYTSPSPRD